MLHLVLQTVSHERELGNWNWNCVKVIGIGIENVFRKGIGIGIGIKLFKTKGIGIGIGIEVVRKKGIGIGIGIEVCEKKGIGMVIGIAEKEFVTSLNLIYPLMFCFF